MKILVEQTKNGYLIKTHSQEDGTQTYNYDNIRDVLEELIESFGEFGSRHDKKRLYLIEAPGDKHPDFTEAHADVIWGKDNG